MAARPLASLMLLGALLALLLAPLAPGLPTFAWVGLALVLGGAGLFLRWRLPPAPRAGAFADPIRLGGGESLLALRAAKDRLFKEDPDSPLLPAQRARFTGLRYYPPDPAAVLVVQVHEFAEHPPARLVTNTGQPFDYLRWGEVHFTWQGVDCRLTVYRADPGDPTLFAPFGDLTNGQTTYGGGRYVELVERADGSYVLDFNRAYNPYCAYNSGWSCPLPPPENRLPVAIEAGERAFEDYPPEGS
jgi:uncharacterized protein (DUF1684 family)